MSKTHQLSKQNIPLLTFHFAKMGQEAASGIFKNLKMQEHAQRILKKISTLCVQINAQISSYNRGNHHLKNSLIENIKKIKQDLINPSRFPRVFNQADIKALEGFLAPIDQECEYLFQALNQKEQEKERQREEKERKLSELLRDEQKKVYLNSDCFAFFLQKLSEKIASETATPTVYFAYAWPSEERVEDERWVQDFLKILQNHLKLGGIYSSFLDIVSNRYGANIYDYMKKTQTSDYVLLFGTQSLKDKHDQGISAVCTELIHIMRKRQKDLKKGLRQIFPILLSGNHQNAFPDEFERYIHVQDWRNGGYLNNFQRLYLELFGLNPEHYLRDVKELWNEALDAFPEEKLDIEKTVQLYTQQRGEMTQHSTKESVNQEAHFEETPLVDIPDKNEKVVIHGNVGQLSQQNITNQGDQTFNL